MKDTNTVQQPIVENVTAVIVTCHRSQKLERGLRTVVDQKYISRVIVVDNGSLTDQPDADVVGVVNACQAEVSVPIDVVRPGSNLGPAGGFALGIEEALSRGADWLWLMDDDIEPASGCLETLLETALGHQTRQVLFWPEVREPSGIRANHPGWWGLLISADIVRVHGLPRSDLVWWSEDTEFIQWRLNTVAGLPNVRIREAVVRHWRTPTASSVSAWKLYYQSRNALYVRLYLKRTNYWRLFRLVGSVTRRALQRHKTEKRLARVGYVCLGLTHGLLGRLGKTVELRDME